MKKSSLTMLLSLLAILPVFMFAASAADLSGTWVGSTEIPGAAEPDALTLVLTKSDDSYTGTISDSMGMAQNAELQEVTFEDNTLSFHFTVDTGEAFLRIDVSLTVDGTTMSGSWESEDGNSASIELEKEG